MNNEQIEKLKEIIKEEEKYYNFNDFIFNWITEEDLNVIENIEELKTYLEDLNQDREITDEDVIYYYNAIEYLSENDASLLESIELATEYGYNLQDINSELLASLLKSKKNLEDYDSLIESVINKMEQYF